MHALFMERSAMVNMTIQSWPTTSIQSYDGYKSQTLVSDKSGVTEIKAGFWFWPAKQYKDHYGDPTENGLGHAKRVHNGVQGYAIFDVPTGVIRVEPTTHNYGVSAKFTQQTHNGRELYEGEHDEAFAAARWSQEAPPSYRSPL